MHSPKAGTEIFAESAKLAEWAAILAVFAATRDTICATKALTTRVFCAREPAGKCGDRGFALFCGFRGDDVNA